MADPMDKAERAFKKEGQRREGAKNLAEYQQNEINQQKKTARLRALRLAHEAKQAEIEAAEAAANPTPKKTSRKKPAKKAAAKAAH